MADGYDLDFLPTRVPLPGPARDATELTYPHFSVLLDRERRLAAVTGVNIDGALLRELPRTGDWQLDPRVDARELEKLFAADVVSYTDGNGVKLAARIPVIGRGRVAQFVAAFAHHFWTGKSIGWVEVNGQPAATLVENGEVTTMVTVTASDEGIEQLLWVMSPQKLGHITAVAT